MKKAIGWITLLVIVIVAVIFQFTRKNDAPVATTTPTQNTTAEPAKPKEVVTYRGMIGNNAVKNPKIQQILLDRYSIKLDFVTAGSIEMTSDKNAKDYDFFLMASQTAADILKTKVPNSRTGIIFTSPMVFYTWTPVSEALVKQGLVRKDGNSYFFTNLPKFLQMINDGKTWDTLGLPMKTKMTIGVSDPTKTNSGSVFAAMLANTFNDGNIVEAKDLPNVMPGVKKYFQGHMDSSTSILFDNYLRTGMGGRPIIVSYENSMLEFATLNPDVWAAAKDKVSIIYPDPTFFADHFLVTNAKAKPLVDAIMDPEIQSIIWKDHGFRTGVLGAKNDMSNLPVNGISSEINNVMQMPSTEVMDSIISNFQ